jgi:hypothetical protein
MKEGKNILHALDDMSERAYKANNIKNLWKNIPLVLV